MHQEYTQCVLQGLRKCLRSEWFLLVLPPKTQQASSYFAAGRRVLAVGGMVQFSFIVLPLQTQHSPLNI